MVLDWMRRESERRLDRGEREGRRGRDLYYQDWTETLRHTHWLQRSLPQAHWSCNTHIYPRRPSTLWEGREGREYIVKIHIVKEKGGRLAGEGKGH